MQGGRSWGNEMQWVAEHFAGLVQRCRGRPGNLVYVNLYHVNMGGEDTAPAPRHIIARLKLLVVQIPELRDLNSAQSCCRPRAGRARRPVSPLTCPAANPITSFCWTHRLKILSSAFRLCNSVVGPWGICEKTQFLLSGCLSPSMWCPEQININVTVPQALLGTCSLWEAPQYSDDPHFWLPPINRSCFLLSFVISVKPAVLAVLLPWVCRIPWSTDSTPATSFPSFLWGTPENFPVSSKVFLAKNKLGTMQKCFTGYSK